MSKPRCTSDWNSCRRWVPQDEAVQFETPLDQLKQNIQDTLIKPNQEALVSQLLLIRSCLDSCRSFVFVVALVYVSYFVFVRHVRNSFLNLKSARWAPPIHTTLFPFCPIPPLQVPEGEEVEFETPLSSLNKGASWQMCQRKAGELAPANSTNFNYTSVVKTWPLA